MNGLTTGALEGTGAASEEGVAVLSPEMGVKPVGLVELLFLQCEQPVLPFLGVEASE